MTLLRLPEQSRPREKLLAQGVAQLSDTELLAVLIRSGNQGLSALDIARCLLQTFGSLRGVMTAPKSHLCKVTGIGETKFCEFQAAMEICRRHLAEPLHERSMFHSAEDAFLVWFRMGNATVSSFLRKARAGTIQGSRSGTSRVSKLA